MAQCAHLRHARRAGCERARNSAPRGHGSARRELERGGGRCLQGADPRAIRARGASLFRHRAALGRWHHHTAGNAPRAGACLLGLSQCASVRNAFRRLQDVRSKSMFKSLLIANRGEIAVRIMRTARRLGLRTIAVYSDADAGAYHVREADDAVHIGAAAAKESYLVIERIIEAAKRSGAEAIHPGYGFLSENVAFAEECEKAGLVFVGPPASAIRAMGLKDAAKALRSEERRVGQGW